MSKPLTDVEKIRKLPWLVAGDSLNASYFLLTFSGSVFLLFLNEVGLNTSQIGVLLALIPFANMIAPIVAPTVARIGVKRAFISFRAIRMAVFSLLLFTPLVLARFGMNSTFIWVTAIIALFSFVRSIGETGVFPWVKEIIPNDMRGKFNAINSISSTIVSIIIITTASWVIDTGAGLNRFTTLITLGTGLGILSLISYTQLPGGKPVHLERGPKNFFKNLKMPFQDKEFIRFLQVIGLVTIGSSATFSFIPLFMKQNIGLSEGNVVLLNVGQYAGAILSSYMWGWLTDRYGSKPIMQLSLCLLASLPIFWFFLPRNSPLSLMLATGIAFVLGVANLAWQISWARHLYVNATTGENQSTYMAVFFAWMGLSEGLGPLLGGQLLSLTQNIQFNFPFLTINAYAFLFAFSLMAFVAGLMVITSLPTEDTPTLRRFTGMFLRGNMFRALESMIQYNFAGTEEAKIVTTERMGDSQNPLSANELIEALNDPSYNVRYQAVNSIGRMPPSPELIDALIASLDDVTELNFAVTRSLGRLGDPRAIPPLRKLLFSGYHLLETNSARALAMLNDKDSIPYLLEKMRGEPNLTLRVAFAAALGKLGAVESIAELSDLMVQIPKDVLRGEVGLALARIAGDERYYTQHWRPLRSNLNTAAGQAVLAFQKQARRLKLEPFIALTEPCADNFAQGNLPEGVAHVQQMIACLPAENLAPALVEIMRRCAQNLATAPHSARPELLLLAFHTIDTAFQQLGSPDMDT